MTRLFAYSFLIVASLALTPRLALADEPGGKKEEERVIKQDDRLSISIFDLQGPGIETVAKKELDKKGQISLPYLKNPLTAKGLTLKKLEAAIVKAYRDENLLAQATVSVKFSDEKPSEGL
jgi:Polysaccharide biosynthesis/export protein